MVNPNNDISFSSVHFVNSDIGYTVGDGFGISTIFKTLNGGSSWENQSSGTLNFLYDVYFTDPNNGTAIGAEGTIQRTTDGGINWFNQPSGTSNRLYGVCFPDTDTGYIVGEFGTILKTTNGGGIIPVELTSFTAFHSNITVQLNWSTSTELNNRGFEIERSSNKTNWRLIGFKEGNGTTTETHNYFFVDDLFGEISPKLYYRLKQIDFDGSFKYSDIVEVNVAPTEFSLSQNYPNPFNPSTKISWQSPIAGWQTLRVYDVLGNEVATLVDEYRNAGSYEVEFNVAQESLPAIANGVYFYRLQAGDFVQTKKMILLK